MTTRVLGPVPATAVRVGRTNLGAGTVRLDDDTITVAVRSTADERPVRLSVDSIDSVAVAGNELVLSLRNGGRVTIESPGAAQFAKDVLARCRSLPELTRALRTFGSRRGSRSRRDSAPAEQRRFLAPLLEARRLAGAADAPAATIAAFDGGALSQAFSTTLREFAAERYADPGPARRALEAELDEIAEPLMTAITVLVEAGNGARTAVDDLTLWRAWAGQLRSTFEIADRVWILLDVALDATPLTR
jgi:hypothetical protein